MLLPWEDTVTDSAVLSSGVSPGCLEALVAEGSSLCLVAEGSSLRFSDTAADVVTTGPMVDVPWVVGTVSTSDGAISVS